MDSQWYRYLWKLSHSLPSNSSPVQPLSRASARERKPVFVGKYQVDITSFEQTALPSLNLSGKEQSKLSARSSGGGEQSKLSTTAAKSSGGGLECPSYQKDTRLSPDNGRGSSTKQEEQLHGGVGGRGAVRSLLVIDEVGKMELYSRRFVDAVGSLFQRRDVVLLATIPVAKQKSHWLVEELRHRTDCLLFEVALHPYAPSPPSLPPSLPLFLAPSLSLPPYSSLSLLSFSNCSHSPQLEPSYT